MKGYRTLLWAFTVAFVGAAEATNWADLIPDGPMQGWIIFGIGVFTAFMRIITTTPVGVGGHEEER